jgi:pimeloyl-ACP methyl ester carboxylesterase
VHVSGACPWIGAAPERPSPAQERFLEDARALSQQELAYAARLEAVARALQDSPAGLASWLGERFRRWSDCGGELERRFTKDALLTNLTLYWATGTLGSSIGLYREAARDPGGRRRVAVPTAMLVSPRDPFPAPREWAERSWSVVRWTELDRGGHFLDWEEPERVAADLRAFFGRGPS